jgi:hypothetical protein
VPQYAVSPQNPKELFVVGKPNPSPDGKVSGEQHWVVLHDSFNGQAAPYSQYAKKIATANSSFDDFMHIPSFEEQAELMAESFPREALDFAWRDHPEYIRYLRTGTKTFEAPQTHYQPAATAAPAPTPTAPAAIDDEIDPDAEAAFAQLQAGVKAQQASTPPFNTTPAAKGGVDDIVAEVRARAQAALQSAASQRKG